MLNLTWQQEALECANIHWAICPASASLPTKYPELFIWIPLGQRWGHPGCHECWGTLKPPQHLSTGSGHTPSAPVDESRLPLACGMTNSGSSLSMCARTPSWTPLPGWPPHCMPEHGCVANSESKEAGGHCYLEASHSCQSLLNCQPVWCWQVHSWRGCPEVCMVIQNVWTNHFFHLSPQEVAGLPQLHWGCGQFPHPNCLSITWCLDIHRPRELLLSSCRTSLRITGLRSFLDACCLWL